MPMTRTRGAAAWMMLSFGLATGSVAAAGLRLEARADGVAVADVVLSLHATGTPAPAPAGGRAVMDQRNSAFAPGVLAIEAGTAVAFPNSDTVQHQVYSFSAAKPFELPLYSGTPPAPVVFDQPGVVVVGCNIHDWMIGHIVVLDTPYFGKTGADGRLRLEAPPGRYQLRAWHPRLRGDAPVVDVVLAAGAEGSQAIALELSPPPPDRRTSDRLRALQERLRRVGPGQ